MPSWAISCKSCLKEFEQAKIDIEKLADYFHPAKPEIPDKGITVKCPFCGHETVYHRENLHYKH
jgi:hypothetical protein